MSTLEALVQAGFLPGDGELGSAEQAALESLTEEELEALLQAPRSAGRTSTPTFHVVV